MDLLHVDDEAEFSDLVAAMLEREPGDFTVHTATSAAEGLELLSPAIDCVVSDDDMPAAHVSSSPASRPCSQGRGVRADSRDRCV